MWVLPTPADASSPLWDPLRANSVFVCQRLRHTGQGGRLMAMLSTLQNVLDTKQPMFRILIRTHADPDAGHLIAVADSLKAIDKDWAWLEASVVPGLADLDDAWDKEVFAVSRIQALVQASDSSSGNANADEKNADPKFRAAARAWRQTFQPPPSDQLVNFYACAYGKSMNQGWMYVSMAYIHFYSLVFGVETRVNIEVKDIEDVRKANSKKGLVPDAIRVTTKDKTEHVFANLFHRDETYELLQHLTNLAMQKLLQNTTMEPAPGLAWSSSANPEPGAASAPSTPLFDPSLAKTSAERVAQLKHMFEQQQRNQKYQALFSLPPTENLLIECRAVLNLPQKETSYQGTLYISSTFLCFSTASHYQCQFSLPFFTIKRVEKISGMGPTVAVTVWHQFQFIFQLLTESRKATLVLDTFKEKLQGQVALMKGLKSFLSQCPSEALIQDKEPQNLGLGSKYGFLETKKDKSKLNYWVNYYKEYGRNLTLLRLPTFIKLVRVGLPNAVRGETWDLCSGAMYRRYLNPAYYEKLHADHAGQTSLSTEEIEKDLNRSLPEYPAYQNPEGINVLRRVLYAFSFHDPEIGYCQAMNLVVSAMLVYVTEEQAFWIIVMLAERLLPGYYSMNMIGAVLDNHVFETLIGKYMPILSDHFKKCEIQISVAALPWFLSMYVNTFPLAFSLRVMDCFFLEGPKVLFQIGLAILKMNGEGVLKCRDDGELMGLLRDFFLTLGTPVTTFGSTNPDRNTTKFNVLMLTAYREFQSVTQELVLELRRSHQAKVAQGLDVYARRGIIRNLTDSSKFSREQLLFLCDQFYSVQFYGLSGQEKRKADKMSPEIFRKFIGRITTWGDTTSDVEDLKHREGSEDIVPIVGSHVIDKLFHRFLDKDHDSIIDFQTIISGLGKWIFTDMMSRMNHFFRIHDADNDDNLSKEEIIQLSESLLFICRKEDGDKHLNAVSQLINKTLSVSTTSTTETNTTDANNNDEPKLSVSSFRELVLGDPFLTDFFDSSFISMFIFAPVKTQTVIQQSVNNTTQPQSQLFGTRPGEFTKSKVGTSITGGLTKLGQTVKKVSNAANQRLRKASMSSQDSSEETELYQNLKQSDSAEDVKDDVFMPSVILEESQTTDLKDGFRLDGAFGINDNTPYPNDSLGDLNSCSSISKPTSPTSNKIGDLLGLEDHVAKDEHPNPLDVFGSCYAQVSEVDKLLSDLALNDSDLELNDDDDNDGYGDLGASSKIAPLNSPGLTTLEDFDKFLLDIQGK